ncbi:MAG: superfamily II DNA or RNA helicase [Harvfovirus sp.]|uniref:Superfamily II DNA or RNA helicase n=1 Tax=Harvfovirus sp. TaxID=2487768 RepID=A0A3G5A3N5_9VIRU|nr:MAG: superfamily II DNA or RNA helicase [Harvfovirus sp.]
MDVLDDLKPIVARKGKVTIKKAKAKPKVKAKAKEPKAAKESKEVILDEATVEVKSEPVVPVKTTLTHGGYRINKKLVDAKLLLELKTDLTVKPFSADDPDTVPYPIFQETPRELIVPRYYGVEKFGVAEADMMKSSVIKAKFTGELRDFQIEIVDKCLTHIREHGGGILSVGCGRGKCLGRGTKVLMFDGTIKAVEDIKVDDYLMGDDSTQRRVLSLARGMEEMFAIIPSNSRNEKYVVNRSHILSLKDGKEIVDVSVDDYLRGEREGKDLKGYRVGVNFSVKDVSVNPYVFGTKLENTADAYIPYEYKCNSETVRSNLLAGIVESFGIDMEVRSERLVDDVVFLCRSLGYVCFKTKGDGFFKAKICGRTEQLTYDISVESVGWGEYYGFEIDGNHRFLLGDFTVTHNTVMSLKIAMELGVKTLVIVHKSFLQDQWMERAKQFTDARVGIIRQNKVQVLNKDIVIGMIQSVSMKEYDPGIFSDFGMVIYDECHHVASRVFSNALAKTGAKFTLGLSATPIRLDGLTRVIHWYVGEFIHREENRKNKQVIAKIFHYVSNNPLFREKKRWFKGGIKPDTIKMTSNLCELEERTNHIVDIINQLRGEAERKILVLSSRKSHLAILKGSVDEAIAADVEKNVILVGECKTYFYTGDSKREERKEAETSGDILFATFELAHEGLDIERLNTIILASPKKNIIQAVGRIMRKILISGDVRPLIIDLSDEVSVFKYQSEGRTAQYAKNKYKLEHYYLKNNKIITFDTYMQQEQNLTQEEIVLLPGRTVYEPDLRKILDMQRVEYDEGDLSVEVSDNVEENYEVKNSKVINSAYMF